MMFIVIEIGALDLGDASGPSYLRRRSPGGHGDWIKEKDLGDELMRL